VALEEANEAANNGSIRIISLWKILRSCQQGQGPGALQEAGLPLKE
jgi:hypothetical protein